MIVIAATGHRPNKLGGFNREAEDRLRLIASRYFAAQRHATLSSEHIEAISGMAQGWDQAFALAALDMNIPLICAVPHVGQDSMWPALSRDRYASILQRAKKVVVVSSGSYAEWKMQRRNEWMVNHCTRLAALWNGSSGGTGNCVQYAINKSGVAIDHLWPAYSELIKSLVADGEFK